MSDTEKIAEAAAAIPTKGNDHLLKCETYDYYATEGALRKEITKKMKAGLGGVEFKPSEEPSRLESVMPGLVRIGKNPSSSVAYLSFANEEAKEKAKEFLVHLKGKKSQHWEVADAGSDDVNYFINKNKEQIKRALEDDPSSSKRPKPSSIHDFTEPLYQQPYADQLKQKESNINSHLRKMKSNITWSYKKEQKPLPSWLPDTKEVCPFEGVVPSPVIDGYRNKVELSIGYDKDQKPAVGFLFGKTHEARGWIEGPYDMKIVSALAKSTARKFTEYMLTSGHAPYDKLTHEGMFRSLLIREGVSKDDGAPVLLVDVQLNIAEENETLTSICEGLAKTFTPWAEGAAKDHTAEEPFVGSLSVTYHTSVSNMCPEDAPCKLVLGAAFIEDCANGLRFKVSPRSFFQVNSKGNEVLLNTIGKYASLDEGTVLLDLCCGTGTIGISLAGKVKKVVGIDIAKSSIEDAKLNAAANGVENVEYYCGKCEDLVEEILGRYKGDSNVVAIVDPPRGGLHKKVLTFLRNSNLQRFVYVSCNQNSLCENTTLLCKATSTKLPGAPFVPTKAIGVDLFPHCDQQELIVLFERQ
eukprot:TRINITY_DN2757_c2_g1_i1.p1 TRINITY_DN2757_c2_g1~~TRINITY_DN2757_c2_g1_i1.p1  ORF type:complete len:594 (+),score=218.05 TRINITY_DN2757_c2_g1_i1:39-1784(+)